MAIECNQYSPLPVHAWGRDTRILICRDICDFSQEELANGWTEKAVSAMGLHREDPDDNIAEFYALSEGDTLLAIGSLLVTAESDLLYLKHLAVPPEQRGKGYGGQLLSCLELKAAEQGTRRLQTNAINDRLIAALCNRDYTVKDKHFRLLEKALGTKH